MAIRSQRRLVGGSRVELIGSLSSLQVIDDLQNVTAVLVFSRREADLLVPFDVIEQIVIDGLKAFIENLEVVSSENISQLLDIFEVSVSILCQALSMIFVVPS